MSKPVRWSSRTSCCPAPRAGRQFRHHRLIVHPVWLGSGSDLLASFDSPAEVEACSVFAEFWNGLVEQGEGTSNVTSPFSDGRQTEQTTGMLHPAAFALGPLAADVVEPRTD